MMDQLQIFSSEVSRVAREVGTEGILGGQAQISGVDGTWKELTDNGTLILQLNPSKLILKIAKPINVSRTMSNRIQSMLWRRTSPIK